MLSSWRVLGANRIENSDELCMGCFAAEHQHRHFAVGRIGEAVGNDNLGGPSVASPKATIESAPWHD
jgi:hypothetical protein